MVRLAVQPGRHGGVSASSTETRERTHFYTVKANAGKGLKYDAHIETNIVPHQRNMQSLVVHLVAAPPTPWCSMRNTERPHDEYLVSASFTPSLATKLIHPANDAGRVTSASELALSTYCVLPKIAKETINLK